MTIARLAAASLAAAALQCGVAIGADDTLDLGNGAAAVIDKHGVIRVTRGGRAVIDELFVGTWVGDAFKSQWDAVRIEHRARNGHTVRQGVIRRDGADQRFELYARTTEPDADGRRDLVVTVIVDSPEPEPPEPEPQPPAGGEPAPKPTPDEDEDEEVDPRKPAWHGKAAVLARLPIDAYAGRNVRLTKRTARLPNQLGDKPLFVLERAGHDLAIGDADGPDLYVGRQDPGVVVVQDARKWGTRAYELQFLLMPTRGSRPRRRSVQLRISLGGRSGPTLLSHRDDRTLPDSDRPPVVPVHKSIEFAVDLWAKYDNPFDATQIRLTGMFVQPDRTVRAIRGFLFQDFERELEAGREVLAPVGPRDWRVRFTPTQPGEHRYWLLLQTPDGKTRTAAGRLHAKQSDAPGFVGVHPRDRRFFARDGRTFFLVGHNVCWGSGKQLSYDYDTYFRRMQHAGENYTRIWMCSWDTAIESHRLDSYRLDAAWRLDYILRLAERRGIVIKLCFDNEHDYQTPDKRPFFGIWEQNGGPCKNVLQFFTLPAMKAAYKRRVDYILARWGYSPNLMAWEMWNEMNYIAAKNPKSRTILLDWTAEMAAYIKSRDPYGHLVTTSLGLLTVWDELWNMPDIDFAQIHCYLPQPDSAKLPEERDAVLAVLKAGERVAGYGKPYHVSEFGYLDLRAVNRTNEQDPTGVHLHNAIWGSLLSGAAGTPSNWWWKRYIHEKNLYHHYAAAAGFLEGIDLANPAWQRVTAAGSSAVRVIGIKKADGGALWLQQRGNDWHRRIVEKKPPVPLDEVKVRLRDMTPAVYRVIWWDPSLGEITRYRQKTVRRPTDPRKHDLTLRYKTGLPDVAVKVERLK
jgi:hypothetical protein